MIRTYSQLTNSFCIAFQTFIISYLTLEIVRALTFETSLKVASYQLVVSEVMTPKSDFLLIETGAIAPKGSMDTANFGKTPLFVE